MRFLLFTGFAHTRTYSSPSQAAWSPGEVRPVPDEEAAYLLETFPAAFEEPGKKPPATPPRVVEEAPVARTGARKKRG